jgi:hypothetical protein
VFEAAGRGNADTAPLSIAPSFLKRYRECSRSKSWYFEKADHPLRARIQRVYARAEVRT